MNADTDILLGMLKFLQNRHREQFGNPKATALTPITRSNTFPHIVLISATLKNKIHEIFEVFRPKEYFKHFNINTRPSLSEVTYNVAVRMNKGFDILFKKLEDLRLVGLDPTSALENFVVKKRSDGTWSLPKRPKFFKETLHLMYSTIVRLTSQQFKSIDLNLNKFFKLHDLMVIIV